MHTKSCLRTWQMCLRDRELNISAILKIYLLYLAEFAVVVVVYFYFH